MHFIKRVNNWQQAFEKLREGYQAGELRGVVVVNSEQFNQALFTLIEIYPHNANEVIQHMEQTHSKKQDFNTILLYKGEVMVSQTNLPFVIMVMCKHGDRLCDGIIVTVHH